MITSYKYKEACQFSRKLFLFLSLDLFLNLILSFHQDPQTQYSFVLCSGCNLNKICFFAKRVPLNIGVHNGSGVRKDIHLFAFTYSKCISHKNPHLLIYITLYSISITLRPNKLMNDHRKTNRHGQYDVRTEHIFQKYIK